MCMAPDLVQIRALAKEKEDENWRFRRFVKECDLDPDDMDRQVFETTKRVWAHIDCTACANCCREVRPTFSEEEVSRLAIRLGVSQQQFVADYLQPTEGEKNPWETRTKPCPFLKDNRCSVYEDRPADCKGYPYLYEPEFPFRTMAMIGRTFTCPIVYEVIEELKQSWGFRRRKQR
jgi:Fe-S-cluster containining protein